MHQQAEFEYFFTAVSDSDLSPTQIAYNIGLSIRLLCNSLQYILALIGM